MTTAAALCSLLASAPRRSAARAACLQRGASASSPLLGLLCLLLGPGPVAQPDLHRAHDHQDRAQDDVFRRSFLPLFPLAQVEDGQERLLRYLHGPHHLHALLAGLLLLEQLALAA